MKKRLLNTLCMFCLVIGFQTIINAQAKNTVFVEGLGSGLIYSLNYDHRMSDDLKGWGIRIGFNYSPFSGSNFVAIPVDVNYLFGTGNNHLELGLGVSYLGGKAYFLGDYEFDTTIGVHGTIMYRYQKPEGGFMFRIGFTPIYSNISSLPYWMGLGFGWSFK